jgi:predicted permease
MQRLSQDVRYALRMLRANPGFTAVAILTLALGIGANTAIFSLTDQVLLRTLPVERPDQLVILRAPGPNPGHTWSDGDNAAIFSFPMYKDLREHNPVFSGLLARYPESLSVAAKGQTAERSNGELVSGNYFEVLGVKPALGRVFTPEDETAPGANPVAVLSYGYWTRRFGGNPGILNKELIVNGTALTVVGVTRAGFTGIQVGQVPDVFVPITMKAQMTPNWDGLAARNDHWVAILGRLKPGYTSAKAEAALAPGFRAILESELPILKFSANTEKKYVAKPLKLDSGAQGRLILQHDAEKPLLSLMAMVGLVLLIACANLASLMVARGEARQREIALRMALGASRWRLVRQLLTESLLLAIAGGVAGLLLASWTLGALVGSLRQNVEVLGLTARLDYRVLAFAIGLSILTGVLFGFAPAMRSSRADLQATLKDQGANVSEGRSNVRLRKLLLISQVALTAVLLATAGFFAQSLWNLKNTNLGIRTDHVVKFSVAPGLSRYSPEQTVALFDRTRENIAALPGVRSVMAAEIPLLADDDSGGNITPEGYTIKPDEDTHVLYNFVSANYFSTLEIPLLSGREFRESDSATSPKVTIVNETLVRTYFAGRNPVGLRIAFNAGNGVHPDIEIVGVVKDSKHTNVREVVRPFMYVPYAQEPALSEGTFYVRTAQDPTALVLTLRKLVHGIDANLPMFNVSTLAEQADESIYPDRLLTAFSLCLGLLAALLAAIGLYGVLAYVVARRTRELGIRIALGATKQNVAWLILREVVRMCGAGLVIGLAAAFGLGKLIESQLFGVKASDPRVFVVAGFLLTAVAMLAGWLPARKAASVDPMVALRHE